MINRNYFVFSATTSGTQRHTKAVKSSRKFNKKVISHNKHVNKIVTVTPELSFPNIVKGNIKNNDRNSSNLGNNGRKLNFKFNTPNI